MGRYKFRISLNYLISLLLHPSIHSWITLFSFNSLKPENVLLDSNGYIKLADFGLSELDVTSPTLTKVCGTPEYVCPDMLF